MITKDRDTFINASRLLHLAAERLYCYARVAELAKKWGCDETDIDAFAQRAPLKLTLDGNQWCATKSDFTNLQESPAGFGGTKFDAVVALAKELELTAGKMWRATLLDLLKVAALK